MLFFGCRHAGRLLLYRIISTRRWHMLCAISWLFHFRDVPPPPHALYILPLFAIKHHATHHWPNAAQPQTLNLLSFLSFFAFLVGIRVETTFSFNSFYYYYYKAQDKSALNTQRNSRCLTTRLFITQQWPQRVVVLLFSYTCRDGKKEEEENTKLSSFVFFFFIRFEFLRV